MARMDCMTQFNYLSIYFLSRHDPVLGVSGTITSSFRANLKFRINAERPHVEMEPTAFLLCNNCAQRCTALLAEKHEAPLLHAGCRIITSTMVCFHWTVIVFYVDLYAQLSAALPLMFGRHLPPLNRIGRMILFRKIGAHHLMHTP